VGSLSSGGVEGEILRDVSRTFPSHRVFEPSGVGQDMLANILKVVARVEEGVGYCQGQNYVAGVLAMLGLGAIDEEDEGTEVTCLGADPGHVERVER